MIEPLEVGALFGEASLERDRVDAELRRHHRPAAALRRAQRVAVKIHA